MNIRKKRFIYYYNVSSDTAFIKENPLMQKSITKSLNTSEVIETINTRKVKIYMQLKKAKNYNDHRLLSRHVTQLHFLGFV